jgi:hypothetical protein
MAGRPKDTDDIRVRRERLGIHTRDQAPALVNRFFLDPHDQAIHQLPRTLTQLF